MRKLGELQSQALDSVRDDYESPQTIVAQIAESLGRSVTDAEILEALLSLCRMGMVTAFVFDEFTQKWRPIAPTEAEAADDPWFWVLREFEAR